MKYYNIELLKAAARELQQVLTDLKIKYEISGAGAYYHFEILTDATGADKINSFLEVI